MPLPLCRQRGELTIAVGLLVEASIRADLLQFELLHRNGVERTALDAEGAANAALLVQDHRPTVLPAVCLGELRERPFRLQLIDVHHMNDPLGADVGAGATEHAAHWVEPDVVVAHQTARALGDRLLRTVSKLDLCREVHRGIGGRESFGEREYWDVLSRDAVIELRHVVTPRTGDAHIRIDLNLHRASEIAVNGIRTLLRVARRLNHGCGTGHKVSARPDATNVGGVCSRVHLHATASNLKAALHRKEGEIRRLGDGGDDRVRLQD
ncbi:MAG: hypothetical protein RLZZ588_254, partial [Chloroflexota bacterium]